MTKEYEYLLVGSGVAGSTLAKRLLEKNPATSMLILEAGLCKTIRPHCGFWLEI